MIVTHEPVPGPHFQFDWSAVREGWEPGSPVGYGVCARAAMHDLLDQEQEMSSNPIYDTVTVNSNAVGQDSLALVGYTFNPSGDPKVTRAKLMSAELIDMMIDIKTRSDGDFTRASLADFAIQALITAQMWAVKVITWRK